MKKSYTFFCYKTLVLLTLLMLSGYMYASSVDGCTITKANNSCFSTTISSVTLNSNNTYTIVLTVTCSSQPGPTCHELSHYSVEALPKTYSNVIVHVVSGGMKYDNTVVMGPELGASTPFQGFKIDNTSGIGDGNAGIFTVTYTLTQLQAQQTAAKSATDFNIAAFTLADFQSVLNCSQPKVAPPTFSLAAGIYPTCQTVTLSATSGADIRYTINDGTPDATSTLYTGPLTISSTSTIKAIAIKTGMNNSDVVSNVYTINLPQVAMPTFSPVAGTYTSSQNVTISTTPGSAKIYYTINGDAPTITSNLYSTPIAINSNITLKAIAVNDCMLNSNVMSGDYVFDGETHNLFPTTGFASVAFEDLWPAMGDYDMNDIVVDCKFDQIANPQNKITKVQAQFVLRAMGASFNDGFGIQLPVTPDKVTSCVVKFDNGESIPMTPGLVHINSNGLEQGQDKAVVILFDDGFKVLPQIYNGIGVNTTPGIPWTPTRTINMTIVFSEPMDPNLLIAPYNPFIFANKRGAEIHLPNNPPTSLADMTLFNMDDDNSSVESFGSSTIRSYLTPKNLPWAILFYKQFDYPIEKTPILNAFLHFKEWAQSGGATYQDWYFNTASGYRDNSKIYVHP
jgi:LruC domain-containing protein